MDSNNSNDVIEISDESNDDYPSNSGTSSIQGTKRQHSTTISDTTDDSSDSDAVEWIENESESEPDVDCDVWDEDCIILEMKPNRSTISGFHLMPTCSPDPEINPKKIKSSIEFSKIYLDDDFKKLLKDNFGNDNMYDDKVCEIICDPWKVLIINDLFRDVSVLEDARQEMYEIAWNKRSMDLYEFFQSDDLKSANKKSIKLVDDFLKTDLKAWVEEFTGLEFTEVSATCSHYSDTDFLVVHDDQRENRAIAYVLYLTGVEGWSSDWGGSLQLFDRDDDNQPNKCARSIIPKNNQLVLFPVSDRSYHQVQEVNCKDFSRMSINGWFHVKEPVKFDAPTYVPPKSGLFSSTFDTFSDFDINLGKWVNKTYLADDVKESIHGYIEENSQYSLEFFFTKSKLDEVFNTIGHEDIKWNRMGPPNRRNYDYISVNNLPQILIDFINLFRMKSFINLLKEYTELELTKMKWELQKWTPGCFSLLEECSENRLDVITFLGETNVVGGKTNYVTLEDREQTSLVNIPPSANTLNLVYGDTARYTSFVSNYSKSKPFYILIASYFEDED